MGPASSIISAQAIQEVFDHLDLLLPHVWEVARTISLHQNVSDILARQQVRLRELSEVFFHLRTKVLLYRVAFVVSWPVAGLLNAE